MDEGARQNPAGMDVVRGDRRGKEALYKHRKMKDVVVGLSVAAWFPNSFPPQASRGLSFNLLAAPDLNAR